MKLSLGISLPTSNKGATPIQRQANAFKARVIADGGVFEWSGLSVKESKNNVNIGKEFHFSNGDVFKVESASVGRRGNFTIYTDSEGRHIMDQNGHWTLYDGVGQPTMISPFFEDDSAININTLDKDSVIITEGYTDCILPYQVGIKNIVASCGTALTVEQIRLIRRYTHNAVMLFDMDPAGESAMMRSLDTLIEEGINVKVAQLTKGHDPDSFICSKLSKTGMQLSVFIHVRVIHLTLNI